MTTILGISAFYHDSAAAIIVDGAVVAAAQEERFSRKKHDASFPKQAIEFCLAHACLEIKDLDHVVFYEKPFLKFERILETSLAFAPLGVGSFCRSIPTWLRSKLYISRIIRTGLNNEYRKRILFTEHHESHAASAFFPSPFDDAAILTADGAGEWATTTLGVGRDNRIELHQEIAFPDSLGLLYSAFTFFCGFRVNSGEGKLMGLAPYGDPIYVDTILENIVDLKSDGSFRLDQSFFDYCTGTKMTSSRFDQLFGGPPRVAESEITKREHDLAASIQDLTETILLRIASHLHATTGMKNLCIAGGVGLNCVANGRLLKDSPFDNVWIQPAAGDAGGAIGAALFVWHQLLGRPRQPSDYQSQFLGPDVADNTEQILDEDVQTEKFESQDELTDQVAELLESGRIVGWVQNRMEFGPRALGNRSILASPFAPDMKNQLNKKIKFRESFRPFAPVVLAEMRSEIFDLDRDSPYMLTAADVREHAVDVIPAATHVDGSARIQTVSENQNPILHHLLTKFHARTGCPVLINTSFNVRGEPIVCNATDTLDCFFRTDLDAVVIGNLLARKLDQQHRVVAHTTKRNEKNRSGSILSRISDLFHQITFPIRWFVSVAVLTIIYFIFITPVGVIWRLLNRRARISSRTFATIDRDCESYWRERPESPDKSRYFKQY